MIKYQYKELCISEKNYYSLKKWTKLEQIILNRKDFEFYNAISKIANLKHLFILLSFADDIQLAVLHFIDDGMIYCPIIVTRAH